MRLLFVITRGDAIGGATIHVRDMASHLIADGHEALVLLGEGTQAAELLRARGVPFKQLRSLVRSPHPWHDVRALIALVREMRRFRPDLVSTHTSKAGFLGRMAARLLRLPVLYTPHCWSFADNFPGARKYLLLEKLVAPLTTRFVAVSEWERQLGIERGVCKEDNSLTIHNGMPQVDNPLAEPAKQPVELIMVGRFEEQKDHATLIEALAPLRGQDWHLTLIGDGPLRPTITEQVGKAGLAEQVSLPGYSNDIATLLCRCQVFILATLWESFPRSILEAMRAGLPVIASDVGGCAEAVEDGVNGSIVCPRDVEQLRARIQSLLEAPEMRVKMGKESRLRYERFFTFSRIYHQYLALYKELADNG